jgi:hypothetical protein
MKKTNNVPTCPGKGMPVPICHDKNGTCVWPVLYVVQCNVKHAYNLLLFAITNDTQIGHKAEDAIVDVRLTSCS